MAKKGSIFQFELQIYPVNIVISIGQKDRQIRKKFRKKNFPENWILNDNAKARTVCLSPGLYMIRFGKNPKPDIIAHEVFHVATWAMDYIGAKFEIHGGSEEAYAYLIAFITKKIFKHK